MGTVVGNIRVMPAEVIDDEKINKMMEEIKSVVKPPAKVGNIQVRNVAFGLKGLDVTILIPDSAGGLDPVVEEISKVENADNVEVTDVGLL